MIRCSIGLILSPPMQPRHIARELALFSINQLPSQSQKLESKTLDDIVTAVVRSLHDETKELLQNLDFKNIELRQDVYGNNRMIGCNI